MSNFTRRRFIKITLATTAATCVPFGLGNAAQEVFTWQGIVLGADASIRIYGDKQEAQEAIDKALRIIKNHEKQLSLYDENSSLSELNQLGYLKLGGREHHALSQLIEHSKTINKHTNGLFDPTVQALFDVYIKAKGKPDLNNLEQVRDLIGIDKVELQEAEFIKFMKPKMAMTFNGIAQGYITDQVRYALDIEGYKHALINIGEYSAGARNVRIGIANSHDDIFEVVNLRNQAIATSSPKATQFSDGTSHIIHPNGKRILSKWDTVSVIAKNATKADGYSTALALTNDEKLAQELVAKGHVQKVIMKDNKGAVHKIS